MFLSARWMWNIAKPNTPTPKTPVRVGLRPGGENTINESGGHDDDGAHGVEGEGGTDLELDEGHVEHRGANPDAREGGIEEEEDEELVVAKADAVVDPRAVVVHAENTLFA
jgi:hypothetical protein